jgi:hypothetical protein
MSAIPNDPVIDEIRNARHAISASCGHDPDKLVAYYLELQKKYQDRMIEVDKLVKDDENPAA